MGYGETESYLERKDTQKDYVLFSGRLCVVICKLNYVTAVRSSVGVLLYIYIMK